MKPIPDAPPPYLEAVLVHIHRHFDTPLRLAQLSVIAGVSAFHLQRRFRQCVGHSPSRIALLLRLKRASIRLTLEPWRQVTDIALEAGYGNAESFTRAFRRHVGQAPTDFRRRPAWAVWRELFSFPSSMEPATMQVEIVDFPETKVAAVEHLGSTADVYDSVRRLVEWRRNNRVSPAGHATYGVHHDLRLHAESGYRMDICVAFEREVVPNPQGVVGRIIPGGRCARVRYIGSREYIPVVEPLFTDWLPHSGEQRRDYPLFFHYVNVGPDVVDHEMITDVYLPLR